MVAEKPSIALSIASHLSRGQPKIPVNLSFGFACFGGPFSEEVWISISLSLTGDLTGETVSVSHRTAGPSPIIALTTVVASSGEQMQSESAI